MEGVSKLLCSFAIDKSVFQEKIILLLGMDKQ